MQELNQQSLPSFWSLTQMLLQPPPPFCGLHPLISPAALAALDQETSGAPPPNLPKALVHSPNHLLSVLQLLLMDHQVPSLPPQPPRIEVPAAGSTATVIRMDKCHKVGRLYLPSQLCSPRSSGSTSSSAHQDSPVMPEPTTAVELELVLLALTQLVKVPLLVSRVPLPVLMRTPLAGGAATVDRTSVEVQLPTMS